RRRNVLPMPRPVAARQRDHPVSEPPCVRVRPSRNCPDRMAPVARSPPGGRTRTGACALDPLSARSMCQPLAPSSCRGAGTPPLATEPDRAMAAEGTWEVAAERALESVRALHARDRWSSFDRYAESSAWCAEALEEAGAGFVERASVPADGRTVFADWVMPLAW